VLTSGRPHRLHESAKWFSQNFPGEAFYAVKANPGPHVLQELWNGGIHCFDVASLCEIRLVHSLFPNSKLAFMHPIKNFNVISIAYRDYGVRRFVLDSPEELEKIMKATNGATDLTLIVRFSVSNYGSSLPLTGKFGISGDAAVSLMQATRTVAQSLGISFHVGSQAMKPISYNMALSSIAAVVTAANVEVDIVDVGGGFPSIYDMESPPPLDEYLLSITSAVKSVKCFENSALWCEPGRALSAEGEGLLTRVEGVKKGAIYLNDGSFGALYDSVHERWSYPVRVVKSSGRAYPVMPTHRADEVDELMFETDSSSDSIRLVPYIIYGPTCDSADKFPEPLMLPEGLAEGDYLEWGNIGAYGRSMITTFNGFGFYETLIVHDSPWPTLYAPSEEVSLEGISSVLTNFPEEEIFLLDLSRALNNSSSSLYSIDDNNSTHSSDTPSPIGMYFFSRLVQPFSLLYLVGSRVSFQDQSPTQMLFGEPEGVF
jgi:ornithine decarboxylase